MCVSVCVSFGQSFEMFTFHHFCLWAEWKFIKPFAFFCVHICGLAYVDIRRGLFLIGCYLGHVKTSGVRCITRMPREFFLKPDKNRSVFLCWPKWLNTPTSKACDIHTTHKKDKQNIHQLQGTSIQICSKIFPEKKVKSRMLEFLRNPSKHTTPIWMIHLSDEGEMCWVSCVLLLRIHLIAFIECRIYDLW